MKGLYIHIPFCVRKCSYCDFYSLPNRQSSLADYLHAILQEAGSFPLSQRGIKGDLQPNPLPGNLLSLESADENTFGIKPKCTGESRVRGDSTLSFQTLYLGGGTPSLLGPKNLQPLITGLSGVFNFTFPSVGSGFEPDRPNPRRQNNPAKIPAPLVSSPSRAGGQSRRYFTESVRSKCREGQDEGVPQSGEGWNGEGLQLLESTLEVNPESASPEFLQTAKTLGFNRLSFGVQSLSDAELQSVGRIHTAAQAVAAIKLAQKTGFQNISADLIIGLPGQTWHSLHNSLEALTALGLPHLSVYCLSLENGTPLALNPPNNLPSDDFQAELYEKTRTFLLDAGFAHYEISNYARPGCECLHNLNYWRGGEYLGLGPAAASHLDGKRFKNNNDLDAYLQNPTGQVEYVETLNPKSKAAEEAMLRLRLPEEGLNTDELTAKFGQANTSDIILRLDKMTQESLLLKTGTTYRLSPAHILTSNAIFARVISG
jgi:oxygen-independent coproporphyrinogen III oxidase